MIRLLAAPVIAVAISAAFAAPMPGLPESVVPHCLGVDIDLTESEQERVHQIADAGFRLVRTDCAWQSVETEKGKYDFGTHDRLLDTLDKRNVKAVLTLCGGNALYDKADGDELRRAFIAFARAAAARYKGRGVLWEIGDEADFNTSVEDYVKFAQEIYPALKKGDPECTVLTSVPGGRDDTFIENALKLGLLECADALSLHTHGASKPEDAARFHTQVKHMLDQYTPSGQQVPLVSGEWSYSSAGEMSLETQAQYLARSFLLNLMNGLRLSIWHDFRDDDSEHHFGAVDRDFAPKPAYAAAQTLAAELKGFSFAVRIHAESEHDYLLLFANGDDYRLAAWTTGKPHKVALALDVEEADVVSLTGRRTRVEVKDGFLPIELTGAVNYVEPFGKFGRLPIVKVIELDTSACPTIRVLPPAKRELLMAVTRPAAHSEKLFEGTLSIGNARGIRLANDSRDFAIRPGQDRTVVRFKMTQDPEGIYSFSCRILDSRGIELLRAPTGRYSLVETFAEGPVGRSVGKYRLELDDEKDAPTKAKLTYVASPAGAPQDVCAKLDYNFGEGPRFVRVSPRPRMKIRERPSSVRLWVKGDDQDAVAAVRLLDSADERFQQELGPLDFKDWRCLEAELATDGEAHYPICWDAVFLIENAGEKKQKGSVYLGTMMLCYD